MQVHIGAIGHGGRTKRQDLERFTRACLPFFLTEDELGSFIQQATYSIEDFKVSLKRFERKIHSKNSPHLKDCQRLVRETSDLSMIEVESTVLRIIDAPFLMEQILQELRIQRLPDLILINKTSKNVPRRG